MGDFGFSEVEVTVIILSGGLWFVGTRTMAWELDASMASVRLNLAEN